MSKRSAKNSINLKEKTAAFRECLKKVVNDLGLKFWLDGFQVVPIGNDQLSKNRADIWNYQENSIQSFIDQKMRAFNEKLEGTESQQQLHCDFKEWLNKKKIPPRHVKAVASSENCGGDDNDENDDDTSKKGYRNANNNKRQKTSVDQQENKILAEKEKKMR